MSDTAWKWFWATVAGLILGCLGPALGPDDIAAAQDVADDLRCAVQQAQEAAHGAR